MGRFACRAGGVVCSDGRGVSCSMAMAHPAPRVEGASLGLGALGKGPGRPPLVADGFWMEGAAGEASRRGNGHRLDGAPPARLLEDRRRSGGDNSAGGLPNKTGMSKKTKG